MLFFYNCSRSQHCFKIVSLLAFIHSMFIFYSFAVVSLQVFFLNKTILFLRPQNKCYFNSAVEVQIKIGIRHKFYAQNCRINSNHSL